MGHLGFLPLWRRRGSNPHVVLPSPTARGKLTPARGSWLHSTVRLALPFELRPLGGGCDGGYALFPFWVCCWGFSFGVVGEGLWEFWVCVGDFEGWGCVAVAWCVLELCDFVWHVTFLIQ